MGRQYVKSVVGLAMTDYGLKANRSTPCAIKLTPNGVWEIAGDPRKYDSGGEVVR